MWVIGHSIKVIENGNIWKGTVSYSPSIVTMVVSVAVCDIFSVKEWPDLENRVRIRSRSLEMAPFDRSHTRLSKLFAHTFQASKPKLHRDLQI